jgi:hypothetical protein
MYEVSRLLEGAVRVAQLTIAGATWPVVLLGMIGTGWALRRRIGVALPLGVMAALFALQFVLLGAGKPDEYGRFGVFTNCALAVACAGVIVGVWRRQRFAAVALGAIALAFCAVGSAGYLASFVADAQHRGSRDLAAAYLAERHKGKPIAVTAEPAPYGCPPLAFERTPVVLYRLGPEETVLDAVHRWNEALRADHASAPRVLVTMADDPDVLLAAIEPAAWDRAEVFEAQPGWLSRARISWADKPVVVLERLRE